MDLPQAKQANADAVTIVGTGDGGFLVGVTGGWGTFVQFAAVSPGQSPQDAGWLDCATEPCPAMSMAFVPGLLGEPPTLVAGFQAPGGLDSPVAVACWTPFDVTPGNGAVIPNMGTPNGLAAARSADGQLGVVLMDQGNSVILHGFGDVDGGCPNSFSVLTNVGQQFPLGVALTSTQQPSAAGEAFVVGEAIYNNNVNQNELGLLIEPDAGLVAQADFGSPFNQALLPPLALASDGSTVSAVTADSTAGIQLFSYALPGFEPIYDGGVIAPQPNANAPAAASCGPDCTVSAWTYEEDGGETTAAYAVSNAEGCGQGAVLAPIASDGGTLDVALVSVAVQSGTAAIAVASTVASSTCGLGACVYDTQVYVTFCAP
jgi:hypothetical protein